MGAFETRRCVSVPPLASLHIPTHTPLLTTGILLRHIVHLCLELWRPRVTVNPHTVFQKHIDESIYIYIHIYEIIYIYIYIFIS